MGILKGRLAALSAVALIAGSFVAAAPAQAQTWQINSVSGLNFWTCCWSQQNLATFSLNAGTKSINSVTSSWDIADQGWGGQDPNANQIYVGLFDGATYLTGFHVAGGYHDWTHQDYTADSGQLAAFNTALAGIDWGTTSGVTLQLNTGALGYPGWSLQGANGTFAMSASVPEAATWAMMLAGFGAVGFGLRRRKVSAISFG